MNCYRRRGGGGGPLGDHEASADVDGGGEDGGGGEGLRGRGGEDATAKEHHAAGGGEARNSIGDAHEWRVQRGGDTPHRLVAADAREAKLGEHGAERRTYVPAC